MGEGWVPASVFTGAGSRWGVGWVPPSVFTGAGSRWEDTGGCTPILTFPPEGGRERGGGGVPSVFTEVGTPRERCGWEREGEGMGSRIRLQRGGRARTGWRGWRCGWGVGWVPHPSSRGKLSAGNGSWWGRGSARRWRRGIPASVFMGAGSRWGDGGGCTPILTFPPEGGGKGKKGEGGRGFPHSLRFYGGGIREDNAGRMMWRERVGGGGWVPAYARTTDGGEGGRMVGWVALRLGGGMGSRIREDNGWGRGRKDGG